MAIFNFFLQLILSQAFACDIVRNFAADATTAFKNYQDSETKCGVLASSLPFVLAASPAKPMLGTIVLVHGLTAGPDHLRHLANELRDQGYNVVVPILKGHGAGDEYLQEASLEEWKKDVNFAGTIAERLGGPIRILGHSTGGMLAALDASDHPGRYQSIVGLDPVLNFNGQLGSQANLPCLARHIWNFPSEVFAGQQPLTDRLYKRCSRSTLTRQPDVIHFELDREIQDILEKSCANGKMVLPHFNYERPLQALCSLKQGTDELTAEKIKKLPPIHLELTEDPAIFDYQSREQLIGDVKANQGSTVNTLKTDEIEKNSFHDLMLAPCTEHYPEMSRRIQNWFKAHE